MVRVDHLTPAEVKALRLADNRLAEEARWDPAKLRIEFEALIIDPARDVTPYLEAAAAENLRIAHVAETHIHADFVSGVTSASISFCVFSSWVRSAMNSAASVCFALLALMM